MLTKSVKFYFGAHSKFAIIGGGTAGLNVTAHLKGQKGVLESDIRVFEPRKIHSYQPAWSMVAGGIYDAEKSTKLMDDVFSKKIPRTQLKIVKIDPKKNILYTEDGDSWTYEHLIIASGIECDYSVVKGAQEALEDPNCPVGSAYQKDYASKMAKITENFKGGEFVFQEAPMPMKCPGAPQKVCMMTEHKLRQMGVKDQTNINYYMAKPILFGVPKYAKELERLHKEKGHKIHLAHKPVEINKNDRTITFENDQGKKIVQKFDALHFIPHQFPPTYIKDSGLDDGTGYADVDQGTLRHKTYDNVWALGDSSNCPTSKTAAAIFSQTPILINNIMSIVNNTPFPKEVYDGYTSCPLLIGDNQVILAEFKYGAIPDETFPIDQKNPRRFFHFLKRDFFPFAYWNFVSRGLWFGRKAFLPKLPFYDLFSKKN